MFVLTVSSGWLVFRVHQGHLLDQPAQIIALGSLAAWQLSLLLMSGMRVTIVAGQKASFLGVVAILGGIGLSVALAVTVIS